MTPTDTIIALEKALEAGPTPGAWSQEHRMGFEGFWNTEVFEAAGMAIATLNWLARPTVDGVAGTYREANAQWIAACSPLAIRTLLDAHASALRDAARYQWIRSEGLSHIRWEGLTDETCDVGLDAAIDGRTAALDDNTKGTAE
jgi:hypothetical protein